MGCQANDLSVFATQLLSSISIIFINFPRLLLFSERVTGVSLGTLVSCHIPCMYFFIFNILITKQVCFDGK